MSTNKANEKKFKQWIEKQDGGRFYSRRIEGQHGWYAIYFKETDIKEQTLCFWQEIYNEKNELTEIHHKFPQDNGHQKINKP